ncbi:MAG: hypothetical protein KGY46_11465 [Anaerolineales bacterium]|nr:hypothetical protein [Anaerolineales bacterium]
MDHFNGTNRLAIACFISGMIALLCIALIFVLYNSVEASNSIRRITDGIIMPIRNLSVGVTLLTGLLALKDIKEKGGTKKDKVLSWSGIVIGAGWILFGSLVGITFLLAKILR